VYRAVAEDAAGRLPVEFKNPNHPAWNILMHAVWLLATLAALIIFSTNFDQSEVNSLLMIISSVAGAAGIKAAVTHRTAAEQKND